MAILRTYVGTDPAAGVEISEVVPAGKYWRLYAVRATLVNSGVAANRAPQLIFDDGANVFWHSTVPNATIAGQTNTYTWGREVGAERITVAGFGPGTGLPNLVLGPGYRVKTVTVAFDPGDNWGAPVLHVAEFDSFAEAMAGG